MAHTPTLQIACGGLFPPLWPRGIVLPGLALFLQLEKVLGVEMDLDEGVLALCVSLRPAISSLVLDSSCFPEGRSWNGIGFLLLLSADFHQVADHQLPPHNLHLQSTPSHLISRPAYDGTASCRNGGISPTR